MSDLISIIVPIYNIEDYVERCVLSIENQTYKNIEVLLIDDGSTDNSGIICDNLSKKYDNIKTFHKINGGLSDARNYGISKAKGDIISFIDGDDYIDNDMIELLYRELINSNSDISICSKYIDYENGKTVKINDSKKRYIMDKKQALVNINSFMGFDMSFCDKIFKKNLFSEIQFPKGKKCEDFYTMYRVFDKCSNKIVYNAVCKYHYFQRQNSISRNETIDKAYIEASESQVDFFEKNYPDILYAAQTMNSFANLSYYNKCLKLKIKCTKEMRKKINNNLKKNIKIIIKNKKIPLKKKLQATCFCISKKIYNIVYKMTN